MTKVNNLKGISGSPILSGLTQHTLCLPPQVLGVPPQSSLPEAGDAPAVTVPPEVYKNY